MAGEKSQVLHLRGIEIEPEAGSFRGWVLVLCWLWSAVCPTLCTQTEVLFHRPWALGVLAFLKSQAPGTATALS